MSKQSRLMLVSFVLMLGPMDSDAKSDESWQFLVAPYVWVFDAKGDVTIGDTSTSVDLDFLDDVTENFDKGYEFHMEAIRGKWRFILDPTYLKTTTEEELFGFAATQTSTSRLIELKLEYQINEPFALLLGTRYTSQQQKIKIPVLSLSKKESTNWWDPVIGFRYSHQISPKWRWVSEFDMGGFNLGDSSDFTWNLSTIVSYQAFDKTQLAFGYRVIDVSYDQGTGMHSFKYDIRSQGLLLGIFFWF